MSEKPFVVDDTCILDGSINYEDLVAFEELCRKAPRARLLVFSTPKKYRPYPWFRRRDEQE